MKANRLKLVRTDAQTQLADQRDTIMKEWADRVKREVPAAAKLSDDKLYNGLFAFLDTLGAVISTTAETPGGERHADENFEICRVHGTARASTPGYTLDQIISEYRILRQVILEFLEFQGPLEKNERTKLLESIDNGMTQAATEFTSRLGFPWSRQFKEMQVELEDLRNQRNQRETFMNSLAHDLRTPLTAAKTRAELILREKHLSDLVTAMAANLIKDIERSDRMIKDLLDVSLLRAGEKLPLHTREANLYSIAKNTLQQLSEIYGDRFLIQGSTTIKGNWDPDAIRRILENLCTNAIKYGSSTSPVTVTLAESEKNVEISVHNQGQPLTPGEQEVIFGQFRQTKRSRLSPQNSWGIGLTIVRGLTESHGGRVNVQSSEKQGTTFRIILPRSGLKIMRQTSAR